MTWEAIAGFVTAGILFGAAFFAWRQVRAARRGANAQVVVGVYEHLRSAEALQTLRLIYRTKPEDVKKLLRSDIDNIERLLDGLDWVGHLVDSGILAEYLAVEAFAGAPALKCWHQLRQFIEEVRDKRGSHYCRGVQQFAKCTVKYQIKHAPRDQWFLFFSGTSGEEATTNLVEKELIEPQLLSRWELCIAKAERKLRSIWRRPLRGPLVSKNSENVAKG